MLDILPKFCYFCVDWSPNMAAIAGFSFKIEPYVKMNKSFFLETTNIIESKLNQNSKMAATAGLSF